MDAQLENVLDAYAASDPGPSRATLVEWIREYPQFARELTEFTAQWQLLEWADEAPAVDAAGLSEALSDEDRLLLRGMSAAQSAFYALHAKREVSQAGESHVARTIVQSAPGADGAPIASLFAAAKHIGCSYAELRDRVGISDALLRKLDRRLIDPSTIPARMLGDLAAALKQQVQAVAAYLALSPTFVARAQHYASQAPTLPTKREDFFDAVRNDVTLSDARKQELLALPQPTAGGMPHGADPDRKPQ